MSPTLTSVAVYPVKSTAGHRLERARVLPAGLEDDRRWMLVDGEGRFLTARDHPRLVQVRATPRGDGLTLEAPGAKPLHVAQARGAGDPLPVQVWRDALEARTVDARADAWFAAIVDLPCTLVYMPDGVHRGVDAAHGAPGDRVSFADGYPLLLVGEASLADLNRRTPARAAMARFRPNVTVAGAAPYAEDHWRRVRIGPVEFQVAKPSDRCVLTTVDPERGVPDPHREPLRTLASYRRDPARGILFGVNLIPRGDGNITVGDEMCVLD